MSIESRGPIITNKRDGNDMTLDKIGNHLIFTIMGEANLSDIEPMMKVFLQTLTTPEVAAVEHYATLMLASREPVEGNGFPEETPRQDAMIASLAFFLASKGGA